MRKQYFPVNGVYSRDRQVLDLICSSQAFKKSGVLLDQSFRRCRCCFRGNGWANVRTIEPLS